MSLIYGIITGILFGFLLQKGHVLRYDKQVGALRLMDMTILKFMLSAILVAAVGIYLLNRKNSDQYSKTTILQADSDKQIYANAGINERSHVCRKKQKLGVPDQLEARLENL
nr:hypothetical protein [uncultured Desulfobacter sp.]